MTNLIVNTLTFDTERRLGAADQAILMPSGSVPVVLVFGESLSMGAESTVTDAQLDPSMRVFDTPYRGRTRGYAWNSFISTSDGGANFTGKTRAGLAAGGTGDAFEEAISRGGGVALGTQAFADLTFTSPVWGLLEGLYGLFRDELTGEIILPRVIQVGRTASYAGAGDAKYANNAILSWAPVHDGAAGATYKSCYEHLKDEMNAARTALTGTDSYLVGAFTTLGIADTDSTKNTGGVEVYDNMAANVGDSIQDIRDALEAELGVDPFPFVGTMPRIVVDSNDKATLAAGRNSMRAWSKKFDMSVLVDSMEFDNEAGSRVADDLTNPHLEGRGSINLGRAWARALRTAFSSTDAVFTAPQFSS